VDRKNLVGVQMRYREGQFYAPAIDPDECTITAVIAEAAMRPFAKLL